MPNEKVARSKHWLTSEPRSPSGPVTSLPTWKVMLGTALGMAPLCFAQAYLADELLSAFPNLVWPLIGLCAVYVVAAAVVIRRMVAG